MKAITIKKIMLSLAAVGLLVAAVLGFRAISKRRESEPQTSAEAARKASPADLRIKAAESKIEQAPNEPDGYNLLASAYSQKAREAGDFSFNAKAEAALSRSLEVAPDNYDALKLSAKLLLTYHR